MALNFRRATVQGNRLQLMEVALATVTDAVLAGEDDGRLQYLNPAAEALTGWRSSEALGKTAAEIFCLKDALLSSAGETDVRPLIYGVLIDRRGREVPVEYAVSSPGGPGCGGGMVIVARPRRRVGHSLSGSADAQLAHDDALFEEKERAEVTLNSIGDAVISTDFSGRVSYLNVVAEKMTGRIQVGAAGGAVDDIFRLVDATTRESIPCPTTRAIIENRRVSLETVCVLCRHDGGEIAVEVSAAPIHDRNGGVVGAVMVAHDVTAARELSSKLARLALHDSLTDLPNRALFSDRLRQAMGHAREHSGYSALLYVDLDRFKQINDSLGHAIGDTLLQAVARRLLGCVRSSDTVSRQGGDEFVVLLADIAKTSDAVVCATKILAALDAPYRIAEHELRLTASIGIAIFPDDAVEGEALLRCADAAMYQAKYNGRNNYKLFSHRDYSESVVNP